MTKKCITENSFVSLQPNNGQHVTQITAVMAFTLGALLEATLLVVNAICVLHERRFLAKFGWASDNNAGGNRGFGDQAPSSGIKNQILNIIHSTRTVMRYPLIPINVLVILKKLILG